MSITQAQRPLRGLTVRAGLALAVVALFLATATGALAAAPAATTSPATNITASSATLNGTVTPAKPATTYYFEYGTTTAYGTKTAPATVNGNATKSVSATVSALKAGTHYHFRIVASNGSLNSAGSDQSFTTALVTPHPAKDTVSIGAPRTVVYGRTGTVTGTVSGPGKGGVAVVLKAVSYPYTGALTPTGQTTTTAPNGTYSFTVRPRRNTRYEVTAATKVPVTSSPATTGVHVRVVIHVSTQSPRRGQRVRFYGTVYPAHNGRYAQIQRRTATGSWRTVASTKLVRAVVNGTVVSHYSRRIRIYRGGLYRVRVNPRDGDHLIGNSAARRERIR